MISLSLNYFNALLFFVANLGRSNNYSSRLLSDSASLSELHIPFLEGGGPNIPKGKFNAFAL